MPAPSTYIDITTTPYSRTVTQAEFNGGTYGGTANEVWFRRVATGPEALGNFTNHGGTFTPKIRVYASDGTTLLKTILPVSTNTFAWFHILSAGTYFVRITRNAGGASDFDFATTWDVESVDALTFDEGDLVINDDSSGYPATRFGIDGTFKGFITGFPAGEFGAIRTDRVSAWHDRFGTAGSAQSFAIFDSGLVYGASSTASFPHPSLVTPGASLFYAVNDGGEIYTIAEDGTTTDLGVFLSSVPSAIAVNEDESILYWVQASGSAGIHQFDLNTLMPMSDLHTVSGFNTGADKFAVTGNNLPGDLIRMRDGSLVTWWYDDSAGQYIIIQVSDAGTLLQSWTQSSPLKMDHLASYAGSATLIDAWMFTDGNLNTGRFGTFDLSTGNFSYFETALFSEGVNLVDNDDTLFGPSASCTMLRYGGQVRDLSEPCCCDCPPATKQGTSTTPIAKGTNPGPVLPPIDPTWTPECTGGGDVPTASDLTDPESWANE